MTVAELKRMDEQELENLFNSMPEPSFHRAINTDSESLTQVIEDFSKQNASQEDRECLQNDLANIA